MAAAAALQRATERKRTGLTLLEGPHLVAEAVHARAALTTLFALLDDHRAVEWAEAADADLVLVDVEALARISGTGAPQSPVAVLMVPAAAKVATYHMLAAVDLADPGNLGSLIRIGAAFGMGVLAAGGADPWAPKVLRSAAGGHFRIVVERAPAVDPVEISRRGYRLAATLAAGGDPPATLHTGDRWAVLLGNEGSGLPARLVSRCEAKLTIPVGVESLNAAIAGSIVAYELSRNSPGNHARRG